MVRGVHLRVWIAKYSPHILHSHICGSYAHYYIADRNGDQKGCRENCTCTFNTVHYIRQVPDSEKRNSNCSTARLGRDIRTLSRYNDTVELQEMD